MRTVGIVVEYNPMHNGHVYHIQNSKKITQSEAVVAVMSGSFLQRGEPALVDKWVRTEMALLNGVDLVLEMPVLYSTQSARMFAYGAIRTLDALSVVDAICFGSEHGEIEPFLKTAPLLTAPPEAVARRIQHYLLQGYTYPRAYGQAFHEYNPDVEPSLLDSPNNMLGLEYVRTLQVLNSTMKAYTIQRVAAGYHDETLDHPHIASATAIRKAVAAQQDVSLYMPLANAQLLQRAFDLGRGPIHWDSYQQSILSLLMRATVDDLSRYVQMDESLATRFIDAVGSSTSVLDLIARTKTKRYTWTRIQRSLTALMLNYKRSDQQRLQIDQGPTYIRVLGFTSKGRQLLRTASKTATLPIFTKISKRIPDMMEWDIRAEQLHGLAWSKRSAADWQQMLHHPVISME